MIRLLIPVLLLSASVATAQIRADAFGVMGSFVPLTPIDKPFAGAEPLGGDIGYTKSEIWGGGPPATVAGGTLLTGFSWERIVFRYQHPQQIESPRNLHELGLTVIWLRPLTAKWTLMSIAMPSLNSDFHDGTGSDDLFLSGATALRWQVSAGVNAGVGLYATWVFGDVAVLPMLDVMYKGERARFELAFPRSTYLYRLSDQVEIGATAFIDGGQYNFGDYNVPGARVDHVQLSSVNLGPVANVSIGRGWLLNLQAGMVAGQKYELFDTDDDAIPGGDSSLQDTRFLRAGLTWRFDHQAGS